MPMPNVRQYYPTDYPTDLLGDRNRNDLFGLIGDRADKLDDLTQEISELRLAIEEFRSDLAFSHGVILTGRSVLDEFNRLRRR